MKKQLNDNEIAFKNAKGEMILARIVFVGKKSGTWTAATPDKHYIVQVINLNTNKKTSLDYWGSNTTCTTMEMCYDAIYCFNCDADCGQHNFEDFCEEFGYKDDTVKTYKTWIACKKQYKKYRRVIGEQESISKVFEMDDYMLDEAIEEGLVFTEIEE